VARYCSSGDDDIPQLAAIIKFAALGHPAGLGSALRKSGAGVMDVSLFRLETRAHWLQKQRHVPPLCDATVREATSAPRRA
jgi:hypothetical protein